jgi:hypothetical protein
MNNLDAKTLTVVTLAALARSLLARRFGKGKRSSTDHS